jgi:lysozyme
MRIVKLARRDEASPEGRLHKDVLANEPSLLDNCAAISGGMKLSILRAAGFVFALPACAFATNAVLNMSHYDMMRPDFVRIKAEGVMGVIHEATYPAFQRDAQYAVRQQAATRAGLLWGAYHYGNGSDPIRQADHFLSVVSSARAQADQLSRPPGVLLVLDFEKNGHYPGGTMRVDQAVAFVERIRERTGSYPGLYSGEYRLRQVLNSPKVSPASKRVLLNCWLWIANYHYQPRSTAPWAYWHLWQYCGDGKCDLPRSGFPKSVANIVKAERNIFRGSRGELEDFWRERAWQLGGEKRDRPPARIAADLRAGGPAAEPATIETVR